MRTIQQIIELLGGFESLASSPIKLTVEGFMPLCIESVGIGPRDHPLISVMHCYSHDGDVCRDPDMEFEIQDGTWMPVSYRQDSLNLFQLAIYMDADSNLVVDQRLVDELIRFSKYWSQNLQEQGFLDAAQQEWSRRGNQKRE